MIKELCAEVPFVNNQAEREGDLCLTLIYDVTHH